MMGCAHTLSKLMSGMSKGKGTSSKGDCERVGWEVGGNKLREDFHEKGMEKGI